MAPLTGRKVFAFTASAFAVIIGVNIWMAVEAVRTFPGLEVKNSYVASQTFDADRSAQQALGWTLDTDYADGHLWLTFRDRGGLPAEVASLTATVGRTTMSADDLVPDFTYARGRFAAPMHLEPGKWMVLLEAHAKDGTLFHQRIDLFVKG
jgi:nitrogen fixation protein FixH